MAACQASSHVYLYAPSAFSCRAPCSSYCIIRVQLTEAMPFLLETRLRELGAQFIPGENFQAKVVVDERLITGQNPASATGVAKAIVKKLQSDQNANLHDSF